jgi:hypothetical protein
MSAARSYDSGMQEPEVEASAQEHAAPPPAGPRSSHGLSGRRAAVLVAGLVSLWLVGVFARQVGDASAAANQADQLRARNAATSADLTALQGELALIQQPAFVSALARGFLLGSPREITFTIDPNAPALPANAPGSVGIRPDAAADSTSPFDAWLQALFGQGQ